MNSGLSTWGDRMCQGGEVDPTVEAFPCGVRELSHRQRKFFLSVTGT